MSPGSNNIVHITSVHNPFDTRIFLKECSTLQEQGFDVTLIAQGDIDQVKNKITIKSVGKVEGKLERLYRIVPAIYKEILKKDRSTIIHFHDPELIVVGHLLKRKGYKIIYDVHEDVPRQILSKDWIIKPLKKILSNLIEKYEGYCARKFDAIITVTQKIYNRFPSQKTYLVQNYPILNELNADHFVPYLERPNQVFYAGDITRIRGIYEMVDAIGLTNNENKAQLVIGGRFSPSTILNDIEKRKGWKFCDFKGWLSRSDLSTELNKSRAGLVLFHPERNHIDAQPNKLFEYMSVGLPVIASDFPLWREIIEGEQCGLLVNPMNPEEIANAIRWILEHPAKAGKMGKRGQNAVQNKYNWQKEGKKLVNVYKKLFSEIKTEYSIQENI